MTAPEEIASNFDAWAALAKSNPAAFEARRQALIEETIQRAAPARQRRLRGLQWRIDMERIKAKTPMAACIRLSDMMWDSFDGEEGLRTYFNLLLQSLMGESLIGEPLSLTSQPQHSATILPHPFSSH